MEGSHARPRVGLLTLMFEIYDAFEYLEPDMASFCRELVDSIGNFSDVSWPGICKTRAQVDEAVRKFEGDGLDLVIVVLLTYAPSHIAAKALIDAKLPLLIFNTQRLDEITPDMDPRELIRNHGVHGVQDLCNVLGRADRDFAIVTGHYLDDGALEEVREWCLAASMATLLRSTKVAALGHYLRGMGDFALDETGLLSTLGVEVIPLAQREVAATARGAPEEELLKQMEGDRNLYSVAGDVTASEHEESSRLEWAMRKVLSDGGMNSFSVNFMSVDEEKQFRTLPFLASSKLLSEGYGFAAEGDVLTAVAVAVMQSLAGSASFTEMFTMDPKGGAILMSHMGESNPALAREDVPIELIGADFQLADVDVRPLLLRFALAPGDVTLVNLTVISGGRFKLIAAEGRVLDFLPIEGINTPHYKFQPHVPLSDFLSSLCTEGSSHHFALAYGSWTSIISKIAVILGVDFSKV